MHLVSDFDGVWTDPRPEADYILKVMARRLSSASGLSVGRVEENFAAIEHHFKTDPFQYGWLFDGRVTAFACEDMYGRNHAIASCLWERRPEVPDGEVLRQAIIDVAGDPQRLADLCFKEGRAGYRATNQSLLVPEAATVIESLRSAGHRMTIVSNSKIEHIVDLFEAAGIDLSGFDVLGGARKFHLGRAEQLPDYWQFRGARVSLQRPYYLEVLERLRPDAVIGDVVSLDLALPLYLRASRGEFAHLRAGLIRQPYSPDWALEQGEGLYVLESLAAVPDWLSSYGGL